MLFPLGTPENRKGRPCVGLFYSSMLQLGYETSKCNNREVNLSSFAFAQDRRRRDLRKEPDHRREEQVLLLQRAEGGDEEGEYAVVLDRGPSWHHQCGDQEQRHAGRREPALSVWLGAVEQWYGADGLPVHGAVAGE